MPGAGSVVKNPQGNQSLSRELRASARCPGLDKNFSKKLASRAHRFFYYELLLALLPSHQTLPSCSGPRPGTGAPEKRGDVGQGGAVDCWDKVAKVK